jgi:RNA polymerase sigma factor (sigma-70 family)
VELQEELVISPKQLDQVAFLNEALKRLEKLNPRQSRVVELRYFGGLSVEQIAALLGIAPRSIKRDWSLARVWLFREMRSGAKGSQSDFLKKNRKYCPFCRPAPH